MLEVFTSLNWFLAIQRSLYSWLSFKSIITNTTSHLLREFLSHSATFCPFSDLVLITTLGLEQILSFLFYRGENGGFELFTTLFMVMKWLHVSCPPISVGGGLLVNVKNFLLNSNWRQRYYSLIVRTVVSDTGVTGKSLARKQE